MDTTPEDLEMLCLAALSYRGFSDVDLPVPHTDELRAAITRGLGALTPLRGRWQLVWGPVWYRAPFSVFDDGVVYVARSATPPPHRYVIAIRGTNPIAAFDWIFGDLWVGAQARWPYGDPLATRGAKISLSSALGLSVIRQMRSAPPRDGICADLRQALDDTLGAAARRLGSLAVSLGGRIAGRLRGVREEARGILEELSTARRARRGLPVEAQVKALVGEWTSSRRTRLFQLVADAIETIGDRHAFDLLRLIEGGARLRSQLAPGVDLVTFFKTVLESARPGVDVTVAGHSKGGALASTVALWLADTQGGEAVPEDRWDPQRKAVVRCHSYAGPTAGNVEFVAHSNEVIGANCRRITNPLDVVTLAWDAHDLETIAHLYDPDVARVPGLEELVGVIAAQVDGLGYRHVGLHHVALDGAVERSERLFPGQVIHQHLAGYLAALDRDRSTNVLDFFSPFV